MLKNLDFEQKKVKWEQREEGFLIELQIHVDDDMHNPLVASFCSNFSFCKQRSPTSFHIRFPLTEISIFLLYSKLLPGNYYIELA